MARRTKRQYNSSAVGLAATRQRRDTIARLFPAGTKVVYVLVCPSTGLSKIGRTNDLQTRIGAIQRMSGAPVHLRSVVDDDGSLEAFLHRRFASFRQHGEWFRLDQFQMYQLVCAISEFKGAMTDPPDDYIPNSTFTRDA